MVRFIIVGLWVFLVAIGALMLGVRSQVGGETKPNNNTALATRSYIQERADLISVPIIVQSKVQGYIVAQLIYTIDSDEGSKISVPLGPFINDEIFRIFYGAYSDARVVEMVKFDEVRQKIIDGVNQRFPEPVLKDLLVEQFNYVSSSEIRDRAYRR